MSAAKREVVEAWAWAWRGKTTRMWQFDYCLSEHNGKKWRKQDIDAGYEVGPLTRIEIPLPRRAKARGEAK